MIISKSKNFVYINLEKCGVTSIESALEPYLLPTDILLGSTAKGEKLEYSFFPASDIFTDLLTFSTNAPGSTYPTP
jgi:hypothetical protein